MRQGLRIDLPLDIPRDDRPDEVIARAAQDDRTEFLPLYDRYVSRVYQYCRARLRDRQGAEDATSEVFLKALERLDSYRGGSFGAWIFAIARNVIIDVRRRPRPAPLEALPRPVDGERTPEAQAVAADQYRAVREALAALPEDQRIVIELQLTGWRGAAIAEALGRSEGAVKMLRLRAVRRLRDLLNEAGWEHGEYFNE